MNRPQSRESLSDDGSSSPTDFTSDDEPQPEAYNFITSSESLNRPTRSSLRIYNQSLNKSDVSSGPYNNPQSNYFDALEARVSRLQQQRYGSNSNNSSQSSGLMLDDYKKSSADNSPVTGVFASSSSSSRIPDMISSPISSTSRGSAIPDSQYDVGFKNSHHHHQQTTIWNQRWPRNQATSSSHASLLRSSDNSDKTIRQSILRPNINADRIGDTTIDDIEDDVDDDGGLYGWDDARGPALNDQQQLLLEPTFSSSGQSRRLNTIAMRMCSKLVESRNLIEAIEFVERNRDLIDNLTRIITHDAPAFRNYDMDNYQIDDSFKNSFNPNFWLDREPIITTADGNCQYHAVSLSLTGCELYTPEVRLATAVAVIDNREWFDSMLKLIDKGSVLDLVHTIAKNYSWGDETTLKAIAVAINRRIFLYTCNIGKKDYELVKSLSKDELLDAFREKKYRGGTGIHTYADPLIPVPANNYIMLFHKSEHFIAVLPTNCQPTMFEPYNPIVPMFV